MSVGLKVKTDVKGLDKLKQYIEYVQKFATMKTDKSFQEYIKNKFLETVNKISMERLPMGSTSLEYIENNKIRDIDNGFILYNDMTVATDSEGYDGQFSIALAFEYGTGIVGQNNAKVGAWGYNLKGHTDGWWYPTDENDPNPIKWIDKNGNVHAFTKGIAGFEVYRFTLEEIKNNLEKWVMEYKGNGGVGR